MAKLTTIAALVLTALVALAPASASAEFGFAEVNTAGKPAAPAFPGTSGVWAGTCDLGSASTSNGGVGVAPSNRLHCLDIGEFSGFTNVPFSPWVAGQAPSWRLDPAAQAGAHPDGTAAFYFARTATGAYDGNVRNIIVRLPPGVVGSPTALPQCPAVDAQFIPPPCEGSTQAGVSTIDFSTLGRRTYPVYNVEARDTVTAEFLIANAGSLFNVPVTARGRTNGDYGVDTLALLVPTTAPISGQAFTFWGVPWSSEHDPFRVARTYFTSAKQAIPEAGIAIADRLPYQPSWGPIEPFFTNPTRCQPSPLTVGFDIASWGNPDKLVTSNTDQPILTGCDKLNFDPSITLHPTVSVADSASGLDVTLETPQNDEAPAAVANNPANDTGAPAYWRTDAGLGTAHLRDTTVHLPAGTSFNPAAADGLQGCTTAQVGLVQTNPTLFNNDIVTCPDTAQIGTLQIDSPLLPDPLLGRVYAAPQNDNPYPGSLTSIYLVAQDEERGLSVKLSGKVDLDPATGQISTTFVDNPQLPFDRFILHLKNGPRAPLNTPATCGMYENAADLIPWSFPDSGPQPTIHDPFEIAAAPNGLGCVGRPQDRVFRPGFDAGSTLRTAASYTDFVLDVTRQDGEQELSGIALNMPRGVVANLRGVAYCGPAEIAAARSKTGLEETNSPSCPASSYIGRVDTLAGAGPTPLPTSGKVYFSGPYDPDGAGPKPRAPLSVVTIVPAIAGGTPGNPAFDLGNVVMHTAVNVDPETAQVRIDSTPVPYIVGGVPLRVRKVNVKLDRPSFMLNPTNCDPLAVDGVLGGAANPLDPSDDVSATLSRGFQVDGCQGLAFKPKLRIKLIGGVKRTAHPALEATVTYPFGSANIKTASVALPHSTFLDQSNIDTVCTRVQFAANQCPQGSIYGFARAYSPVLDQPLEGPVYLKSSSNELPDLVAALRGQVDVNVTGRIDSVNGGLRNSFETVPDAPVEKFVLTMKGGKDGLLVNSTNICQKTKVVKRNGKKVRKKVPARYAANAVFTGQNGKALRMRPVIDATGCKKKAAKPNSKSKSKRKRGS